MDIKSSDELYEYLQVLKDAGVARARLGDVEVVFGSAEDDEPSVDEYRTLPAAEALAKVQAQAGEAKTQLTGYASLFNGTPPGFVKPQPKANG